MIRLAFTCGDINGIGPEISIKTFNECYDPEKRKIYYFSPKNSFEKICSSIKPNFPFEIVDSIYKSSEKPELVSIINIGNYEINAGFPTRQSGEASFQSLKHAFNSVYELKICNALITNPISKTAIKLSGQNFSGHTELLAKWSNKKNYLMLFLSDQLKAGLVTVHVPLFRVSKLITKKRVTAAVRILYDSLRKDFNIQRPKIAVLGLNPHAGEEGNIGKEEINIIHPAIKKFDFAEGPFVPDAFFGTKKINNFDAVLAMYHDQALIPFKMINFYKGVNFTAGLPIIRTSPDHGTAFDIAGKNIANNSSLSSALNWAEKIYANRSNKIIIANPNDSKN
ncbi:4-hydroxythreonine-4-phosphate dehydrogenase PdxA [Melioribacteraceae bacterium 4301-Me]|uniref:4-hydroxythreonine-4-phosphate dehydrogenase PdxA n=1 Tax=Pyranulibacter aquaticus TaxID=3163344 RepID=UPI003594A629